MNPKILLTTCIVALTVGSVGVTTINSVFAQNFQKRTVLLSQMVESSSLTGSWRFTNMALLDTPMPMLPAGDTELTVVFSKGRVSGSGGCNRFMGNYTTQGDKLSITELASTFKACEQLIMDQESRYLKALQGAKRFEIDDKGLTIYYETAQESGVLRFVSNSVRGLW